MLSFRILFSRSSVLPSVACRSKLRSEIELGTLGEECRRLAMAQARKRLSIDCSKLTAMEIGRGSMPAVTDKTMDSDTQAAPMARRRHR